MSKLLSIIIPSYNMEKYLNKCISSLIVSSLPQIEVLIINDGSKDSTLEIAKGWSRKYPQSISVIDKPNGNYGSCINAGLKLATGKYIKVLDADDSFHTENLDEYIGFLDKHDTDLIVSDYSIVDESGTETRPVILHNRIPNRDISKFAECTQALYDFYFEMHAVAYKRDLFNRFEYHQTEGISYTDQEWLFKPMAYVESIAAFDKKVYSYLFGREGQTIDPKVSARQVTQTITVCRSMLKTLSDLKESGKPATDHMPYLRSRLLKKIPSIYRICILKTKGAGLFNNLNEFDKDLFKYSPELYTEVGNEIIKFIPFKYVTYWRNHVKNSGCATVPPTLRLLQCIITKIL